MQATGNYKQGAFLMLSRSTIFMLLFTIVCPWLLPKFTPLFAMRSIYVASPLADVVLMIFSAVLLTGIFRQLTQLIKENHASSTTEEAGC